MSEEARRALEANPVWYHTIEFAPRVVTPGRIDLRRLAGRVLPDDLAGARALDVGTFDGFWAFELERRGAEVVAVELDRLDAAALGSSVDRRCVGVYELTPDAIGGEVDLVFSGAILLHLRDPVRALERIAIARPPAVRGMRTMHAAYSARR